MNYVHVQVNVHVCKFCWSKTNFHRMKMCVPSCTYRVLLTVRVEQWVHGATLCEYMYMYVHVCTCTYTLHTCTYTCTHVHAHVRICSSYGHDACACALRHHLLPSSHKFVLYFNMVTHFLMTCNECIPRKSCPS